MRSRVPLRPNPGYTLIELMTFIAVLSVALGIGIPGYASFSTKNKQTILQNTFATTLAQARYQAISSNRQVVLCPSVNQKDCTGGFSWNPGYISFIDDNQNRQLDTDETYLSVIQPTDPNFKIQTSKGRQKITFKPSGMAYGSNTTIRFCNDEKLPGTAIIISNTGRARPSKTLADGSPVTCNI